MKKSLKSFYHSTSIYTRIRNAIWEAKHPLLPICFMSADWEPELDDFLRLRQNTIANIGPVSLKILRAWVEESQ